MKKQALFTALFLAFTTLASAQLTKEKLVGTWKIVGVEINGIRIMEVSDTEEWMEALFQNDLKKEPGKVFTQEDSMGIAMGAELMQSIILQMNIFFRENGTYGRLVDKTKVGKGIIEKEFGTYTIKKDKLIIEEGEEKAEPTASMPDNDTLILVDFVEKQMKLTFKRQ